MAGCDGSGKVMSSQYWEAKAGGSKVQGRLGVFKVLRT